MVRRCQLSRHAAASCVALTLLLGCDDVPDNDPRLTPPSAMSVVPPPAASASAGPKYRSSSLGLAIAARRGPSPWLSAGKGQLCQLTEGALLSRQLTKPGEAAREPLSNGRMVLSLKNGRCMVATLNELIMPAVGTRESQRARRLPRFSLMPGTRAFGDRQDEERLWVHHSHDPTLYRYSLEKAEGALLVPEDFVELADYDGKAFLGLRDGSFLYTAGKELRRFFPQGRKQQLGPQKGSAGVLRLLLARRIDQAWVVREDGLASLVTLTATLPWSRSHRLGSKLLTVASSERHLAALDLKSAPGEPRVWRLRVYGEKKEEAIFEAEVPADPGDDGRVGPAWVEAATRNLGVVLTDKPARVAVGGPERMLVWDFQKGNKLLVETLESAKGKDAGASATGQLPLQAPGAQGE